MLKNYLCKISLCVIIFIVSLSIFFKPVVVLSNSHNIEVYPGPGSNTFKSDLYDVEIFDRRKVRAPESASS